MNQIDPNKTENQKCEIQAETETETQIRWPFEVGEREREPWWFGEREEVRENLNIHPKIFPGTKLYNL